MIQHLESGTCDGDIDEDVILNIMRHKKGPWRSNNYYDDPFQCATCHREFAKLSAMMQHVENSSYCGQGNTEAREAIPWMLTKLRRSLRL